jgi:hypothetical protein
VAVGSTVGVGRVHVGGDAVGNHFEVRSVLGPVRDGVGQFLVADPVEDLVVVGAVQASEHVVERSVLEDHHDDVIEGVDLVR